MTPVFTDGVESLLGKDQTWTEDPTSFTVEFALGDSSRIPPDTGWTTGAWSSDGWSSSTKLVTAETPTLGSSSGGAAVTVTSSSGTHLWQRATSGAGAVYYLYLGQIDIR